MKFSSGKKNIYLFSIAGIALVSVLVIFYFNVQKVKSTSESVEHTQEVLRKSDNVLLDVLNIETGARAYLLTGNDLFLIPFYEAVVKINTDLTDLTILTKDNPSQQVRIDSLKKAGEIGLIFIKQSIDIRKQHGLNEAEKSVSVQGGGDLSGKIRNIITHINSEEFRLLKQRKDENEKSNKNSDLIFLLLLVFVIAILSFVVIIINNQNSRNKFSEKEKQASQYARSLIEASLDPLVTISAAGKITDVNDESVKVTGVERGKLIGTDFSSYFTEPEKAQEGYQKVFEKGFVEDYPLTIKHKNGKLTDVLYNASVYKDSHGNVLGVFAAARDITNRKKAEEQLQAVNKELEAFTYSVSHDLRAPLRAINGYAKILEEDYSIKLDADGMSSLYAIMKNSKKMGDLIDDLLAFSRLGRKVVPTSEINMSVLVGSVKDEEIIGSSNQTEFTIHKLLPAKGQQALIKQVWVNLISNAIKYSQHKLKTVIEIGSYPKDNLIVYYVKDNGVGFDMLYYDKLFGVFQRLHSQEEFEGTGIGLAIVQKIIHRHNGTAWAESKINEGSCFYFTLPTINS